MLFRQLEYFVAVAQERHFARAAEKCYVSQPALSAAIAKLERELDVPLINRGHSFEGLTPEGEQLVMWARRILAEYAAFKSEVRATRSEVTGTLRLGAIPTASTTMSLLLGGFCSAYPLVKVQVRAAMPTTELYRRLRHFELDAAIVPVGSQDSQGLDLVPLYADRYVLISPTGMLPADSSRLRWPDAAQLPLMLLTPDIGVRNCIDGAFASHGISVEPQVETDSVCALLAQVATGDWATILPYTWFTATAMVHNVRAVELVEPTVTMQIALATNPTGPTPPVARAFAASAEQLKLQRPDRRAAANNIVVIPQTSVTASESVDAATS
ncbi:LysR family transcriptional regulator [Mycobacterium branderi]|uniref:Probable hydrogen peroxide-inducible genes activator n=1 Tax=Mycobacterium branderi TaxID=43348 RepID=A0A7I7W2M1_9MYCO|nr:LysR family transcriptional regulator [Mycobacterium branderi]MCV7233699.1 LysR family transcriptional regulator [Mycobacterium branderi]ORA37940.1 LysR family transcriptional regulator [Mycobacterium branderi]BBZ11045.1 LysR family transcriptional regulator [Mycobacterium branderi]